MPASRRKITEADILSLADYAKIRPAERTRVAALKRNRRVHIGPDCTFYFENYDTMWLQVQEMLWIEKGGADQLQDELEAYNPLIPNGHELIATFMIEVDDPNRRRTLLGKLGGIEETAFLTIDGERVEATPEADQDRTSAEGKASSVQFVHFNFTPSQIAKFRAANTQIILGLNHPNYGHMALIPDAVRAELATDFA